ncbi:putative multiple-sugar transport system permease YteP [Spirochaetia bacterium]|nr:putative multiple-sugar transport system permease YteP [Spirochaetia bacterium]
MAGIVIAFQDFRVTRGIMGSPWVGLKHFKAFFSSAQALQVVRNTLLLNIYGLIWGFPIPIIFAISLCEMRSVMYRKIIQTISYLPYFMSMVIVAGLVHMILSVDGGAVNVVIGFFGISPINFLTYSGYFRTIYVATNVWKGFGWTAIIYISAIIGIDPQLYEAAIVDGAGTFRRIWHITIPGILSTIVIMLLLNIGSMMSSAFDLANLLQKPITYDVSDTIATYVYRRGIANASGIPEYSFTTAIGLFQSAVNILLLTSANFLARKYTEASLF